LARSPRDLKIHFPESYSAINMAQGAADELVDAKGHKLRLLRHYLRNLKTIETPNRRHLTLTVDIQGRVVRAEDQEQHRVDYSYGPAGVLTDVSYADGRARHYTYDGPLLMSVHQLEHPVRRRAQRPLRDPRGRGNVGRREARDPHGRLRDSVDPELRAGPRMTNPHSDPDVAGGLAPTVGLPRSSETSPIRDSRRLSLKAVGLGTLTDIVGSLLAMAAVSLMVGILLGGQDVPAGELERQLHRPGFMVPSLLLGLTFTMLGGFVAGRISARSERLHGAIVGSVSLVLTLLLWPLSASVPPWHAAVALLGAVPLGLLGGYLAAITRGDRIL
jgi:hypothetical protein